MSFDIPPPFPIWCLADHLEQIVDVCKHMNLASHQASSSLSSEYKSPGRPIQLLLISHNKTVTRVLTDTHTHIHPERECL